MIAGVNNGKQKIDLLATITRRYPTSSLSADVNMEIAGTYLAGEQYREALPYLKNVIRTPGADALKPKAYLQSGIAWYNLNNNGEALKQYDSLLKQYPNSPEAQDALGNAKSIYVEEGKSSEYVNFAKGMGVEVSDITIGFREAACVSASGSLARWPGFGSSRWQRRSPWGRPARR